MTRTMGAVLLVLAAQMLSRGMDYLIGSYDVSHGIFRVTDSTPPIVWGVACVATSLLSIFSILTSRLVWLRNSCVLSVSVCLGFAVVIFDDIFLTVNLNVLSWAVVVASSLVGAGAGYLASRLCKSPDAVIQLSASLIGAASGFVGSYVSLCSSVDDWRFFTGHLANAAIWGICAWSLTIRLAVVNSRKESCGS